MTKDGDKSREQLLAELTALRVRLAELEWIAGKRLGGEQSYDQALLFHGVSDAVIVLDGELRIRRWNRAAERIYGWRAEEVVGSAIFEVLPIIEFLEGSSPADLIGKLNAEGHWKGEIIHAHRHGQHLCVEISVHLIRDERGATAAIVCINRDISERKQAEKALRESEDLYRSLVETSPDAIVLTALDGTIVFCNQQAALLHGYSSADELVGLRTTTLIAPENRERALANFRLTLRSGSTKAVEFTLLRRDGSRFSAELSSSLILGADGQPRAFIGVARDISERKRVEAALHQQEELYRLITEHTADLISVIDRRGYYLYVSPSYKHILGYDPADLIGRQTLRFIHRDDVKVIREMAASLDSQGATQVTFRYRHADGSWRWIEIKAVRIDHEDTPYAVIVGRDLSERVRAENERRQLEMQLLQMQKMESLGTLASGIAHDVNNVLAAILGSSQMALLSLPADAPEHTYLIEIEQAASRAAALTSQLLTFSRRRRLERSIVNINETINDILSMLQRIIGDDVQVITRLADDLPAILANSSQMQQLVMNLAINARDAMPGGGKVQIETRRTTLDDKDCRDYPWIQPGEYIQITISDTGVGMSPEILKRIFEPFFTTKEAGRGTGLGLAVVYGIVRQHGGFVHVESTPGQGSSFKIFLPLQYPPPAPVDQAVEQTSTQLLRADQDRHNPSASFSNQPSSPPP